MQTHQPVQWYRFAQQNKYSENKLTASLERCFSMLFSCAEGTYLNVVNLPAPTNFCITFYTPLLEYILVQVCQYLCTPLVPITHFHINRHLHNETMFHVYSTYKPIKVIPHSLGIANICKKHV